jgi:chromosomal replication initiation ATPase DnaA
MATKTVEQITEAHRKTIEVFTGKKCTIILHDREEEILKLVSLTEILLTVEKFNYTSFSLVTETVNRDVVKFRKIFCLLAAQCKYSARRIGTYLGKKDHSGILYNLRTGNDLLQTDEDFKHLFNTVKKDLLQYGEKLDR